MIDQLPKWVEGLFLMTSLVAILSFYWINGNPKALLVFIVGYTVLQSSLAIAGFYQNGGVPPRPLFVLVPTFLFLLFGLTTKRLKWAYDQRRLKFSYFLHTIRIPIEIVLYQLYVAGLIPLLMTFEGRNFDILIGIIAPIIGYLNYKRKIGPKALIIWNVIGLGFVLFIVVNAVLSIEGPFQSFAFDQPNKAVNMFPFVILPAVIVPIVIYTHISDILVIRYRMKQENKTSNRIDD